MTRRPPVSARTRVAAVIGDPVRHSLSPLLHNAAFEAAGLDWVYVAFPVAAGGAERAVDALRTLGLGGLNVTMPHKQGCAAACDVLTPDAAALGSVNTVWVGPDGRVHGDSTDGEGFVRALAAAGTDPGGTPAVVVGAGGAARAIVHALGRAGARVTVAARRAEAAAGCASLAPAGRWVALGDGPATEDAVRGAGLVVNATPLGMAGEGPPFATGALHAGQTVVDTVYHPLETPLLRAARGAGARACDGTGMLLHQAALAFERFTGRPAPLGAMREALAAHLAA